MTETYKEFYSRLYPSADWIETLPDMLFRERVESELGTMERHASPDGIAAVHYDYKEKGKGSFTYKINKPLTNKE